MAYYNYISIDKVYWIDKIICKNIMNVFIEIKLFIMQLIYFHNLDFALS